MQLYALDNDESLIFAGSADRRKDYFCLECHSVVHLRGGLHRQNHFYHIQPDRACRQNGKGMEHIQMQNFLYNLLPFGDCELEKRFPDIGRIADVIWLSEKIIFEIQCSSITAEEVRARNLDYTMLGFTVVWILHDKQFNGRRISAVEQHLSSTSHYFTNMNKEGHGFVYDQFDVVHRGLRLFTSTPFKVDLQFPIRGVLAFSKIPQRLKQRMEKARLFFRGDLHEYVHEETVFHQASEFTKKITPAKLSWMQKLIRRLVHLYRIIFRLLLERASY